MKSRFSYFLIGLGLTGLIVQTIYRIQADKNILEIQIKSQESSVIEGLKLKWRKFLEQKAQAGLVPKDFVVYWNRNGTKLKSVFFPQKNISLNWEEYREAVVKKQDEKIKNFLQTALNRTSSWDRILAIEEWKKIFNHYPETEWGYEETLVNPEAQSAYGLIFSQFSADKDFTYASDVVTLDKVFYSIQKDGSIEAFLPSVQNLKLTLLAEFQLQNKLSSMRLSSHALEVEIEKIESLKSDSSLISMLILLTSLLMTFIGFVLFLLQIRDHKKLLLRRVSFLNQVVHELKTPLTGLKLHIQLIQKGKNKLESYEALDTSLDRLNNLFDDVVLMNRPFEKIVPELVPSEDLNKALRDLKTEFSQFKCEENFNDDVLTDLKRFRVVLRNLIKNAIRYGQEAKLEINTSENEIEIFIKDKGPGISASDKDKIFDEFYRSEAAKKLNADGLGLGLFLVKKLCKEMNAEVTLTNPGESGAVFKLKLNKGHT